MKKRSELYVLGPTQPCPDASTSVMILPPTRDRLVPTNNYGVCYDLLPCSLCAVRTIQKQSRDTRAPKEIGVFVGDLNPKLSWVRFVVCAIRWRGRVLIPVGYDVPCDCREPVNNKPARHKTRTNTHTQTTNDAKADNTQNVAVVGCVLAFFFDS